MSDLSNKQAAFVREYVKDFNGKRAAIAAGYSAKTADVQACKMLIIPKIRDAVKKLTDKAESTSIATCEEVLESATEIMRTSDTEAMKLKAGENIAKMKGYNAPDKVDVNTNTVWKDKRHGGM
jgi:phage terminase small subunit